MSGWRRWAGCRRRPGRGPSVDADAGGKPVLTADLSQTGRWPESGAAAVAAGYRSVAALPLTARGEQLGALEVYRTSEVLLAEDDLAAAQTLADVAAAHLVHPRRPAALAGGGSAAGWPKFLERPERSVPESNDSPASFAPPGIRHRHDADEQREKQDETGSPTT
jgi:hypothetical protein